jgi:hypothetical protein
MAYSAEVCQSEIGKAVMAADTASEATGAGHTGL